MNLSNSFTFERFRPISRYRRNNLNMGCDYYIDKNLHIYDYNDKEVSCINLEHEKGFYFFVLDEDEDDYEAEFAKYKKDNLRPYMEPILIYSNNTFNKISSENKYKKIIENELKIVNKIWNDVSKIIKIESRYER